MSDGLDDSTKTMNVSTHYHRPINLKDTEVKDFTLVTITIIIVVVITNTVSHNSPNLSCRITFEICVTVRVS